MVSTGHRFGSAPFFGFGVGTDLKDSDKHILSFEQDGLSFMNRDYYINRTNNEPLDITKPSDINHYFDYITEVIALLEPTRDIELGIYSNIIILLLYLKISKFSTRNSYF